MENIRRSFKKIYRRQKGITGLETAIILIAFVVVASVFAYTVLSAGLFSTQKSQESIHAGLDETQSTLNIKGATIANGLGELVDCNAWINTDSTTVTTFKQDLSSEAVATAPGALQMVDTGDRDEDTDGTERVIGYYVLDEPVTVGGTENFSVYIHNEDQANALQVDTSIELVLMSDITDSTWLANPEEAGNWDATVSFAVASVAADAEQACLTTGGSSLTTISAVGINSIDDWSTTNLSISIDDIKESTDGSPVLSNCDTAWVPGTNITQTGDTSVKMEGSASVKFTAGAVIAANNTLATITVPSRDLSSNSSVSFWIMSEDGLAANDLELVLDDDDATPDPNKAIGTLAAGKWVKVDWDISSTTTTDIDAVTAVLLRTKTGGNGIADAEVIHLDIIETQPILSITSTMQSYADQVSFTIVNAIAGKGVDCGDPDDLGTTDADGLGDGIIDSKDGTQTHRMVVSYSDAYQEYTDMAWTVTRIGNYDDDFLLEDGEQFEITVDLSYVNNNATQDSHKIDKNNTFTIEVKPAIGATLTVERTMPAVIKGINNLW